MFTTSRAIRCLALLFAAALAIQASASNDLRVRTDFPGGSARVIELNQEKRFIRIDPSPHAGRGWECWWYFKLEGIEPGTTITLDVGNSVWATPERAVFSLDNATWSQTSPGRRDRLRIVYEQRIDATEAWFAWGPPFVLEDARNLVSQAAMASPYAIPFVLTSSREGRPVPALRVSQPGENDTEKRAVWVQARQHAWESGSSWVCRGFVEWLVSSDERAEALRKLADIYIVPVMDADNVERGAGGKNQAPHDHNRDWSDKPHWPEVAAAIGQIKALDTAGRFDLFINLHNPAASNLESFFYIAPKELLSDPGRQNLQRFLDAARAEMTGPLGFKGKTIESGKSYDPANWERISKNWVSANTRAHVVAVTLETAWNAKESTTENYVRNGRELGMAIGRYLSGK